MYLDSTGPSDSSGLASVRLLAIGDEVQTLLNISEEYRLSGAGDKTLAYFRAGVIYSAFTIDRDLQPQSLRLLVEGEEFEIDRKLELDAADWNRSIDLHVRAVVDADQGRLLRLVAEPTLPGHEQLDYVPLAVPNAGVSGETIDFEIFNTLEQPIYVDHGASTTLWRYDAEGDDLEGITRGGTCGSSFRLYYKAAEAYHGLAQPRRVTPSNGPVVVGEPYFIGGASPTPAGDYLYGVTYTLGLSDWTSDNCGDGADTTQPCMAIRRYYRAMLPVEIR